MFYCSICIITIITFLIILSHFNIEIDVNILIVIFAIIVFYFLPFEDENNIIKSILINIFLSFCISIMIFCVYILIQTIIHLFYTYFNSK